MVPPASLSQKLVIQPAIWGHVAFFIGTLNLGRVECNGIKSFEVQVEPQLSAGLMCLWAQQ
jgi:hypothetical protein